MKIKNKKLLVAGISLIGALGLFRYNTENTFSEKNNGFNDNKLLEFRLEQIIPQNKNITENISLETGVSEKKENICNDDAYLEYLTSISKEEFIDYTLNLPSDKFLDLIACKQYKRFIDSDVLKDLLLNKFNPKTKWHVILEGQSELGKLEELLIKNDEKQFLIDFIQEFLDTLSLNIREINYLGDGLFKQLEILNLLKYKGEVKEEDWDGQAYYDNINLLRDFAQYAKDKYFEANNTEPLSSLSLWAVKIKYISLDSNLPPPISIKDAIDAYEMLVSKSPITLEELSATYSLIKISSYDYNAELLSIREDLRVRIENECARILSNDSNKLIKYYLTPPQSESINISDFGLKKSEVPYSYGGIINFKNINEDAAIETFYRNIDRLNKDGQFRNEFLKDIVLYAKKTEKIKFLEEVARYFPEIREDNN